MGVGVFIVSSNDCPVKTSNTIAFYQHNCTYSTYSNETVTTDVWTHVAVTVDIRVTTIYGQVRIYINGTDKTNYATSPPIRRHMGSLNAIIGDGGGNGPLKIGAAGGCIFGYAGYIDEVRLWNKNPLCANHHGLEKSSLCRRDTDVASRLECVGVSLALTSKQMKII